MAHTEAVAYALVVGAVILRLRERSGWTQADLAERVAVTQSTLSRIERGQAQPDPYTLRRFAEAFDMTIVELNATIDDAYQRTAQAAQRTLKTGKQTPWWQVAFAVAGAVGLAGLAAFAVSAALSEEPEAKEGKDEEEKRRRKNPPT